jgi:hypothetical protein
MLHLAPVSSPIRATQPKEPANAPQVETIEQASIVPDHLSTTAFKQANRPALEGVEDGGDQIWIGSACRTKDDALVFLDSVL